MTNVIYTYKQIPRSKIALVWHLNDNSVTIDSSSEVITIPGWQKNDDLQVTLELSFNPEDIFSYIRNDRTASFYLTYHSRADKDGTGIHGLIKKVPIPLDKQHLVLSGTIDGKTIAGVVELTINVCIDGKKDAPTSDNVEKDENYNFLASDIGSVIFKDTKNVILEGESSYFPVADIDFSEYDLPKGALYFLQQNFRDLDTEFTTAYRLFFNNKHPQYKKINDTNDSEVKTVLLNMIVYDVYKQLIMNALNDESFTMPEEEDPSNHTLRFVYARLIANLQKYYFQGESLETIRNCAKNTDTTSYNQFICTLQDLFLTLGDI